ELIARMDAEATDCITVYNKCDASSGERLDFSSDAVYISAKTGEGIGELLSLTEKKLQNRKKQMRLIIPYDKGGLVSLLHETSKVICEEYRESGVLISAIVDAQVYGKVKEHEVADDGV
ncbi:MAG: hypothetical protein IJS65_06620, partial [Clostridia bacterium]|nr:hypothetical protein [Clostridia bacterium]